MSWSKKEMQNIKKHLPEIDRILKNSNLSTKISIFFSYTAFLDDYDPYESNTADAKLNPKTIRGYVTEVSPQALIYKQYGLHNIGAKEIVCDARYAEWFRKCAKITIDGDEYQIFKEATGSRCIISDRKFKMIRVVVSRRTQ